MDSGRRRSDRRPGSDAGQSPEIGGTVSGRIAADGPHGPVHGGNPVPCAPAEPGTFRHGSPPLAQDGAGSGAAGQQFSGHRHGRLSIGGGSGRGSGGGEVRRHSGVRHFGLHRQLYRTHECRHGGKEGCARLFSGNPHRIGGYAPGADSRGAGLRRKIWRRRFADAAHPDFFAFIDVGAEICAGKGAEGF